MKPEKPKWAAAIAEMIHEDGVEVASLWHTDAEQACEGPGDLKLARIGGTYLLLDSCFAGDNNYEWIDSAKKVKCEIEQFASEPNGTEGWKSRSNPELVDSVKDSAPLFVDQWDPEEIVRQIEADENFILCILSDSPELPEAYYD
jgi:hypothetical protein